MGLQHRTKWRYDHESVDPINKLNISTVDTSTSRRRIPRANECLLNHLTTDTAVSIESSSHEP